MYADDSYTKSRLGLTSGDDLRLGADVNWMVADRASVYFNVGLEDISSTQFGSETSGDRDWRATVDDDFVTFGHSFTTTIGIPLLPDYGVQAKIEGHLAERVQREDDVYTRLKVELSWRLP